MDPLSRWLAARRDEARAAGLQRRIPVIERDAVSGPRYRVDGRPVVGFCSNDYLGLASQRSDAAASGGRASRLVCGDHSLAREVEASIAAICGTQDAVLFPSGYQLNTGCLPALLRRDDRVYSDRLAHASLIDGIRLSPARPTILRHLQPPPTSPSGSWWVTESVFSMDGDGPTLVDMRTHLERGGYLYLDDAHAFGLYAGGQGRAAADGLQPTATVVTLGKAVGTSGAALAASKLICEHVRTTARSFVYSTAVAPHTCAAILHNLSLLRGAEGDRRRDRLRRNVRALRESLSAEEHAEPLTNSPVVPIVPILLGPSASAVDASLRLLERGFHVQPIRPPTVPEGTARLRLTVTADHELADIQAVAAALRSVIDLPLASAS